MKVEVYQIFDKDNNFIHNIAILGDIVSLMRYKKEHNYNYKYFYFFEIDEKYLEKINDDLAIVKKELSL